MMSCRVVVLQIYIFTRSDETTGDGELMTKNTRVERIYISYMYIVAHNFLKSVRKCRSFQGGFLVGGKCNTLFTCGRVEKTRGNKAHPRDNKAQRVAACARPRQYTRS